jgi:hypothetical protein
MLRVEPRGQNFLDFIQRFTTEFGVFNNSFFSTLNQVADIVNIFSFQAVRRTVNSRSSTGRNKSDRTVASCAELVRQTQPIRAFQLRNGELFNKILAGTHRIFS